MSQQNVEIVRRFLLDDLDEALTYADPGIVWNPIEESPAQGHDAVRASLRGRGRGSGVEVDARFYDIYTLRDGKIVRMDQFTERSEALEAVGRPE